MAKVCPYGTIRTNQETLALQRVDWFVLILFQLKAALEWGLREGGEKLELHLKDKFSKDCIGYEWITKHYRDRLAYIMATIISITKRTSNTIILYTNFRKYSTSFKTFASINETSILMHSKKARKAGRICIIRAQTALSKENVITATTIPKRSEQ